MDERWWDLVLDAQEGQPQGLAPNLFRPDLASLGEQPTDSEGQPEEYRSYT